MKLAELSLEELRELISEIVEAKLQSLASDPDKGLELRDDLLELLGKYQDLADKGMLHEHIAETGTTLEEAAAQLGVNLH